MANRTNTSSTRTSRTNTKTSSDIVNENNTTSEKPIVVKDIDLHQYITVRNGFQGRLVYTSRKTGEVFIWDEFGSEQEIELIELRNAKNSEKSFFINNWFMFDDKWVIDFLGVGRYYKHAINISEFDEIFNKPANEIKAIINEMSEGQKHSLGYRARLLIESGEIDSRRTISMLEDTLGIELIEK